MAGNKRISGVAVPITASIDPKSYEAISQLNKLFGGIQEDQIKNLAAKNPEIAKLLKAPYEQFMLDATKAIKTVDTALAKGATPSDASFMKLVGYNNLLKEMGENALALKASTSISIASNLGFGEATVEAHRLNTEIKELKQLLSHGDKAPQYSATNLLPSVEAQVAIESRRRYAEEKKAHSAAVQARLANDDYLYTSGPSGPNRSLSPAARQMRHEEEFDRNANQLYQLGMSPSVRVRQGLEARHRIDQFSEQDAQQEQRLRDFAAQARTALHSGSIEDYQRTLHSSSEDAWGGLSHGSAAQLRSQAVDRSWARAQAQSDRDMNEANDRRLAAGDPIAQYQADMARQNALGYNLAPVGSRMQNGMLVPPPEPRPNGYTAAERTAAIMASVREQGGASRDPANWNFPGRHFGAQSSRLFGGISRANSHATRFAAQNIGFGIDDAIQSYHYGGIGGSVRAASNNATAIAGMLIANPVVAAATVVGLSVTSAILPIMLTRFGIGSSLSSSRMLSRSERQDLQERDPSGYAKRHADDWFVDKLKMSTANSNSLYAATMKGQYQSASGLPSGSDFANQIMGLGESRQEMSGNVSQRNRLIERKNDHLLQNMKKGGTYYGFFTGDHGDYRTVEIDKQLDELDKMKLSIADKIALQAKTLTSAASRLQFSRNLQTQRTEANFKLSSALRQGGLDDASYVQHLKLNAAKEIETVQASNLGPVAKKAKIFEINQELENNLSNSAERKRQLSAANFAASQDQNAFDYSKSGDTGRVGQVLYQHGAELLALAESAKNGSMTNAESIRRMNLASTAFHRNEKRAIADDLNDLNPDKFNQRDEYFFRTREDIYLREGINEEQQRKQLAFLDRSEKRFQQDEIETINPETNPYKNMQRFVERQQEDIASRDLTRTDREAQTRAMLIAAEKRNEAMIPQARSFISRSTVGSMEDEELRARMTGNYGPQRFRDKHEGQSTEVMEGLLRQLVEELKLKGESIGS